MKKVLLSLFILLTVNTISQAKATSDFEMQLIEKIKSFVMVDKVVNALHLKTEANVWITIKEDKTIHVENVDSGDFLTAFYIKKTLEGKAVEADNSLIGKTLAVEINFLQSK